MVVQRVNYCQVLVQAYQHGGEEGAGGGQGSSQCKDTAEGMFLQERRANLVQQGERGQHWQREQVGQHQVQNKPEGSDFLFCSLIIVSPVTEGSEASSPEEENNKDGIENGTNEEHDANDHIQNDHDKKTCLEVIFRSDQCINCKIHSLKYHMK